MLLPFGRLYLFEAGSGVLRRPPRTPPIPPGPEDSHWPRWPCSVCVRVCVCVCVSVRVCVRAGSALAPDTRMLSRFHSYLDLWRRQRKKNKLVQVHRSSILMHHLYTTHTHTTHSEASFTLWLAVRIGIDPTALAKW